MDFARLSRLASAHVEARAIQAAVSLGIFDALEPEPAPARSVAERLNLDPRATELLLDALVALELLEKEAGRYRLAAVSRAHLARRSPRYLGDMILFDAALWDCWGRLEEALRSGAPVRPPDMYQSDPRETERFVAAMHSLVSARGDAELLAGMLDFSGVSDLLDVGSGPGTYPIAFCRRHPSLRATIFDLPATIAVAERFVAASGMGDRIRLIRGDYRSDPVPGSYQMIFLSNIIHAEGEDENRRLVAKLHSCLEPGGRIVIKDHILDAGRTSPPVGALFSLLMLLTTREGRCYSFDEVRGWLDEAGYANVSQVPLPPPLTSSLVIGEKRASP
jgi:predicted O-methyltransferase YrrM